MGAYKMNQNADNLIAKKCRGVTRNFYRMFYEADNMRSILFFWGGGG